jgi:conjugal transfer mating pair stabilization protein TraN
MRYLFIFMAMLFGSAASQAQTYATILPNTKFCAPGSAVHAVPYCADATPCKVVSGIPVCLAGTVGAPANALIAGFSCWSTVTDYTCDQYISECSIYTTNSACTEVGTATCTPGANGLPMISSNPKLGACISYTRDFKCLPTGVATTTSTTTCDPVNMLNGLDWSQTSPTAQADFVNAATSQEFARQIATYGYENGQLQDIFHGKSMDCKDGWIGLKNCCSTSGGGPTSNGQAASLMGNVTMTAVSWGIAKGAGYALKFGAPYVYDLMLSDVAPEFMQSGLASMANSMQANTLGAGFSFMGVGTSASAAGGALFGASSSMAIGQTGLYFNPYAFAAAVAIQVIMAAISCSDEEKTLANLKSQNLCHPVGSFCSNEISVFGVVIGCLETTQRFCCFNGLLAKGIMEGAHIQMGLSWGTPQLPNCSGLSVAQLQSINFADPIYSSVMAPFTAEIMAKYNQTGGTNISSGAFQTNVQGVGTQNIHALCIQRQALDPTIVCP